MVHPGRLSLTDVNAVAQDFVGQDLLDIMAESVTGTKSLEVNLTNDLRDEVWTFGFKNDDKLVVFLSMDATPPGHAPRVCHAASGGAGIDLSAGVGRWVGVLSARGLDGPLRYHRHS